MNDLVTTPPVLFSPRVDGCDLVWGVSRLARGWVEVEIPGRPVRLFASDNHGFVPQHEKRIRVRIDGLPAGAAGRYRIVTEAMDGEPARFAGDWRSLRTIDSRADRTHFAVWNDTHQCGETIRRLDAATPRDIDFLVWNGDICNDWHEEALIAPTLLHPEGLDISEGRPLCFLPGNHDVRGKWAFRLPEYTPTPEGKPYFAFRSGPEPESATRIEGRAGNGELVLTARHLDGRRRIRCQFPAFSGPGGGPKRPKPESGSNP